MREIRINVGATLLADGIKDALASNCHRRLLYEVAHALLTEHSDDSAEIHDVTIEDVTIDPAYPSQVVISFTTSWSIYVGCRDANSAGDEAECETATYTDDGFLIFLVPVPRREANHC